MCCNRVTSKKRILKKKTEFVVLFMSFVTVKRIFSSIDWQRKRRIEKENFCFHRSLYDQIKRKKKQVVCHQLKARQQNFGRSFIFIRFTILCVSQFAPLTNEDEGKIDVRSGSSKVKWSVDAGETMTFDVDLKFFFRKSNHFYEKERFHFIIYIISLESDVSVFITVRIELFVDGSWNEKIKLFYKFSGSSKILQI